MCACLQVERVLRQRASSVLLHPEIEEVCRSFLHLHCTTHTGPGQEIGCLQVTHWTENPIYLFPEKELPGLGPNSYIHMKVSDIYCPRIGPHIWLQQNRQTDLEIYKSLTDIRG